MSTIMKNKLRKHRFLQHGGISLLMTALLMMSVGLVAMSVLYKMRFGRYPMQEQIDRWSHTANVISNEVKQNTGLDTVAEKAGSPRQQRRKKVFVPVS